METKNYFWKQKIIFSILGNSVERNLKKIENMSYVKNMCQSVARKSCCKYYAGQQ